MIRNKFFKYLTAGSAVGFTSYNQCRSTACFSAEKPKLFLISCGSFNPPTLMHLRIMEEAKNVLKDEYDVIKGVYSPTHDDYVQNKPTLIHSTHRLAMLDLAAQANDWIEVSDWEVRQEQWFPTKVALRHFKERFRQEYNDDNVQIRLLCGADILEAMCTSPLWPEEDVVELLSEFGIAGIAREGVEIEKYVQEQDLLRPYADRIHIIRPTAKNNISSSLIRKLVKNSLSITYLVLPEIEQYIKDTDLYRNTAKL